MRIDTSQAAERHGLTPPSLAEIDAAAEHHAGGPRDYGASMRLRP